MLNLRRRSASFWVLLLVALFELWQLQLHQAYKSPNASRWPITSDGLGYYVYLPAALKYQDFSYAFVPGEISGSQDFFNVNSPKTGYKVNKYPIGVALMQLPFYGLGELHARLTAAPADGFSIPYRLWLMIGALVYQFIGLLFVRRFLQFFFAEKTIAAVLFCLALGTNLLYYSLHDSMMSHVYSFCLMAVATFYTIAWHRDGKRQQLLLLAACCGMIFLIRPVNILFVSFFLLWGLGEKYGWAKKKKLFLKTWRQLAGAACLGLAVIFLQLLTWKLLTGSWFFFSYEGEGFLWSKAAIVEVLISYRKGWFVYTPLAIFLCLGLFTLKRKIPEASIALPFYFLLHLYVISCWWSWWYGGGFSLRPMVELLAPLALALASWGHFVSKAGMPRWLIGGLAGLLVLLNVFQTYQMKRGYIDDDSMTKAAYWAVFGKANLEGKEREDVKKLLDPPPLERRGE